MRLFVADRHAHAGIRAIVRGRQVAPCRIQILFAVVDGAMRQRTHGIEAGLRTRISHLQPAVEVPHQHARASLAVADFVSEVGDQRDSQGGGHQRRRLPPGAEPLDRRILLEHDYHQHRA